MDKSDNLVRFIELLTNEKGLNISQRNITVSTCGIVPGIRKLAEEEAVRKAAAEAKKKAEEEAKKAAAQAEAEAAKELLEQQAALSTEAAKLRDVPSVTYDYYHKNIKPQPEAKEKKGYVCNICGYIHEGDELPEDFICPICKHGKDDFEPVGF